MEKNDPYDDYLKWEKQQNSRWARFSKQIKPIHFIAFSLLFFWGNWAVSNNKLSNSFFWSIIIAFSFLFIFLVYRETNETRLIPEHIIKQIAHDTLEKKRIRGIEIPFDSKVRITLVGEGIYETDMVTQTSGIIRRDVGFEIIKKGYKKTGVIGIHPYSGEIMGIRWEKLGYSGKETRDRLIIPVGVVDQSFK